MKKHLTAFLSLTIFSILCFFPAAAQAIGVSAISPANNAINVSVNAEISVTFDTNFDQATVNASSFSVVRKVGNQTFSVDGAITFPDSTVATFIPSTILPESSTFIVTVSTGITDASGTPLTQDTVWSFSTVTSNTPNIAVDPVALDMGSVGFNMTPNLRSFTISNTGTAQLNISSIALTGGDQTSFSWPSPSSATIQPGQSIQVSVSFAPQALSGSKITTIRIQSNAPLSPIVNIPLSGIALDVFQIDAGFSGIGSVSCEPFKVVQGGTAVCTITPAFGQQLISLSDSSNGQTLVDIPLTAVINGAYTLANVSAQHLIIATFEPNPIDGVCGGSSGKTMTSAPVDNFCSTGNILNFADAGAATSIKRWTWDCSGQYTNSLTAHCAVNYPPIPVVTPGVPPNGAVNVPPTIPAITASFNRDMDPASITSANFTVNRNVKITAISAGSAHSLAIKSDGSVAAWGDNLDGQTTIPAPAQSGLIAVAAGGFHSVALKNDGTVIAWGNDKGVTAIPVQAENEVIAIAAGYQFSLALKSNGSVVSWGVNNAYDTTSFIPGSLASGVTAIAAGGGHGLALLNSGSIVAWGDNSSGQTTIPSSVGSKVTAIAAGGHFSLALLNNGSVAGWGSNGNSQTTIPAEAQSDVIAIAAGAFHSLALKKNGSVVAWGAMTTIPDSAKTGVVAIAAGNQFSLALKTDGSVIAWGVLTTLPADLYTTPISGIISYNQPSRTASFVPTVPLPFGAVVVTTITSNVVSQEGLHPLADTSWSFTVQDGRQMAVEPATKDFGAVAVTNSVTAMVSISNNGTLPLTVSGTSLIGADPTQFSVDPGNGSGYTCGSPSPSLLPGKTCTLLVTFAPSTVGPKTALLRFSSDDQLLASRDIVLNGTGSMITVTFQAGVGGAAIEGSSLQQVPYAGTISGVTAVAAPGYHFINWTGTGGFVTTTSNPLPAFTATTDMTITANFSQAPLVVPGSPANGTPGVSQSISAITAVFDKDMDPATINTTTFTVSRYVHLTQVSGGNFNTLGLRNDGTVVVWGAAEPLPALSDIVAVSNGGSHYLALNGSGIVTAWGYNGTGQTDVPSDLANVIAVAAGSYFSMALKSDGMIISWGKGYSNGFYGEATVPPGLDNVVAIAAGSTHSLALRSDGSVIAWGSNNYGERDVPSGLTGVVAIAAGESHNLALKSNGTVVAWGRSAEGQIAVPADLTDVVAVAAGALHSLALKKNGTVVAWGDNGKGQSFVDPNLTNAIAISAGPYRSLAITADGSFRSWGQDSTIPISVFETPLPGTVSYNQADHTASFTPTTTLPAAAAILVTVRTAATALNGTQLQSDTAWGFQTQGLLSLTFQLGTGGSGFSGNTNQQVPYNGTVESISAAAAPGYHFLNWTGTYNYITSRDNPLPAFTASADMKIKANFAHDPINGTCGYTPLQILVMTSPTSPCWSGIAGQTSGTGTSSAPWTWQCAGDLGGTPSPDCSAYANLQAAYDTAVAGGKSRLMLATGTIPAGPAVPAELIANATTEVTIAGGYNATFQARSGMTVVTGAVRLKAGKTIFDGVALR